MFSRTSNDQKPLDMFLEAKVRTGSRPMEKFQYAGEGHKYLDGSLVPRRDYSVAVSKIARNTKTGKKAKIE